jgi:hypothetical protein
VIFFPDKNTEITAEKQAEPKKKSRRKKKN